LSSPVDTLLDEVEWEAVSLPPAPYGPLPYVTHKGELHLGDLSLRCFILSDGQRIFDADDIEHLFGLRRKVKP